VVSLVSPIYLTLEYYLLDTMGDERTQCRLPDRLSELLDEAATERDVFRSELTRRALRYYIGVNPDGIGAFDGMSVPGIRGSDAPDTADSRQPGGEIGPRAPMGSSVADTGEDRGGGGGSAKDPGVTEAEVEDVDELLDPEVGVDDVGESPDLEGHEAAEGGADGDDGPFGSGCYDPVEDL